MACSHPDTTSASTSWWGGCDTGSRKIQAAARRRPCQGAGLRGSGRSTNCDPLWRDHSPPCWNRAVRRDLRLLRVACHTGTASPDVCPSEGRDPLGSGPCNSPCDRWPDLGSRVSGGAGTCLRGRRDRTASQSPCACSMEWRVRTFLVWICCLVTGPTEGLWSLGLVTFFGPK